MFNERIKSLYTHYKDSAVVQLPTESQQKLILKLGGDINYAQTLVGAQKYIKYLLGNQPITDKQRECLSKYPSENIALILKKDTIDTRNDFKKVINILGSCTYLYVKNHPLEATPDYEYGWQESKLCPNNKLYYITYYDILMIDCDTHTMDQKWIEDTLKLFNFTGRIYKTHKGYHIFITSQRLHYKNPQCKNIMELLGCDFYYIVFCSMNGFKVRLNPKIEYSEFIAAEYMCTYGDAEEDPEIINLLHIHDNFLQEHSQK